MQSESETLGPLGILAAEAAEKEAAAIDASTSGNTNFTGTVWRPSITNHYECSPRSHSSHGSGAKKVAAKASPILDPCQDILQPPTMPISLSQPAGLANLGTLSKNFYKARSGYRKKAAEVTPTKKGQQYKKNRSRKIRSFQKGKNRHQVN